MTGLRGRCPRLRRVTGGVKHLTSSRTARHVPITVKNGVGVRRTTGDSVLNMALDRSVRSVLPLRLTRYDSRTLCSIFLCGCTAGDLRAFQRGDRLLGPSHGITPHPTQLRKSVVMYISHSKDVTKLPRQLIGSLVVHLLLLTRQRGQSLCLVSFSIGTAPVRTEGGEATILSFFHRRSTNSAGTAGVLRRMFALLTRKHCMSTSIL